MMRAKRPRSVHGATQNHNGHSRTRSMSEDNLGDDSLLHMDPSLMTERQQLAFLLRKTAQEQSGADSNATHSSESSEDEAQPKRSKKRIQHARTSPRNARKLSNGVHAKAAAPTPRGRSLKIVGKPLLDNDTAAAASPTTKPASRPTKLSAKRLHVKTMASPTASDAEVFPTDVLDVMETTAKNSLRKPSPSSTNDISHIGVFDEPLGADFWSSHCALCSASASHVDASCEPLFLCQSCDQKYPTQRALGRV